MMPFAEASEYPGLTPAQAAMFDSLCLWRSFRARTAEGVTFTVTGSGCLWWLALDITPDDARLPRVRGRCLSLDLLASWIGTLTPIP